MNSSAIENVNSSAVRSRQDDLRDNAQSCANLAIPGRRREPIVVSSNPEVLQSIADSTTTLAIWRRQLNGELEDAAKRISEFAFELVAILDPNSEKDRRCFTEELKSNTGNFCVTLADDLLDLSQRLATSSQAESVRIRLETVADDGCRKFHLDNVIMRLIVTYRGPGTQWIPPAFAAAARDWQENYEGPLNSIGTGDVAILRGKKSAATDLIIHRSPPVTPSDPNRLVAAIDAVGA